MLGKTILFRLLLVIVSFIASMRSQVVADKLCLAEFNFPAYSRLARQSRIESTVTARIRTDESGRVIDAKIESGHPLFNGPVEDALRTIRTCGCASTTLETTVKFQFQLEGDETDLWAPTHVRFVQPATFIITTAPGPPPLGDFMPRKKSVER